MFIGKKSGTEMVNANCITNISLFPETASGVRVYIVAKIDGEDFTLADYQNRDKAIEELEKLKSAMRNGCGYFGFSRGDF